MNLNDGTARKKAEEYARGLLGRMTPEEKVGQMLQVSYTSVTKAEAESWAARGVGSFLNVLGEDAERLQELALKTRLGIPMLFGIDAVHGHCQRPGATVFPTQLAAACAWDRELVREMGRATAREAAADNAHWNFSPVLCLARDMRWGRVGETFGEDPYLAGELGAALIKGYQGEDLSADDSVLACAKHFIGYGEAVGGRDSCDTEFTFRKMRETFLPPFRKAVEAGCATAMTAYGSVDGTPFTASPETLRGILKDELGFEGFTVTDWKNVESLVTNQRVAADIAEASVLAARAGNDMMMNTVEYYAAAIDAVKSGRLAESVIDEAALRILRIKFLAGLFDRPMKKADRKFIGCAEHLELSRRLAERSVVLLENRGVLPLSGKIKSIAVVGPNADDVRAQYGDWTYFTHPEPNPDCKPVLPYHTVLSGMRELAKPRGVEVSYHRGCGVIDPNDEDIEGAARAAAGCDAIVLALGDAMAQAGERKDRADLSLSGSQQALFDRLRVLGKPLIAVLVSSKPLCIQKVSEQCDALLAAFSGGMSGGLAVAEAIFGEINPSGRLPVSIPRHSGQLPVYYNQLSGWHGGKYVDLPASPLYPFGYGLSYSDFQYSNLRVTAQPLQVAVDVTNSGPAGGWETAQLYFRDCVSSVMTPEKLLVAFEKIRLDAGETKTVRFRPDPGDLTLVTADGRRAFEPGEFEFMAGPDSRDESLLKAKITLKSIS